MFWYRLKDYFLHELKRWEIDISSKVGWEIVVLQPSRPNNTTFHCYLNWNGFNIWTFTLGFKGHESWSEFYGVPTLVEIGTPVGKYKSCPISLLGVKRLHHNSKITELASKIKLHFLPQEGRYFAVVLCFMVILLVICSLLFKSFFWLFMIPCPRLTKAIKKQNKERKIADK